MTDSDKANTTITLTIEHYGDIKLRHRDGLQEILRDSVAKVIQDLGDMLQVYTENGRADIVFGICDTRDKSSGDSDGKSESATWPVAGNNTIN